MKRCLTSLLVLFLAGAAAAEYRQECVFGHYSSKENALVAAAAFSERAKEQEKMAIEDVRFKKEGALFQAVISCLVEEPDRDIWELQTAMEKDYHDDNRYYFSLGKAEKLTAENPLNYSVANVLECKPVKVVLPAFTRGQNWRVGDRKNLRKGIAVVDCFPDNAYSQDWSEMVSVRFQPYEYVRSPAVTAKKISEVFIRDLKKEHGDAGIKIHVHQSRKGDVVYEWWLPEGSGSQAGVHEIARIVTNKVGIFFLSYVNKKSELSHEQWRQWLESVQTAAIN